MFVLHGEMRVELASMLCVVVIVVMSSGPVCVCVCVNIHLYLHACRAAKAETNTYVCVCVCVCKFVRNHNDSFVFVLRFLFLFGDGGVAALQFSFVPYSGRCLLLFYENKMEITGYCCSCCCYGSRCYAAVIVIVWKINCTYCNNINVWVGASVGRGKGGVGKLNKRS